MAYHGPPFVMDMMRYFLYNIALAAAAPAAALYLLCSSRYRGLLRRFRPPLPKFPAAPVWIHACSVGEVGVAAVVIQAFEKRYPGIPVVLSVSTLSGMRLAQSRLTGIAVVFAPFDLKWSVRNFIKRTQPRMLAIIETELWPNLVRETRRSGCAVVVVNGRISPQRYPTYRRYRTIMPPVFSYLSAVGAQGDTYAERFRKLGVREEAIAVTGNMKCDAVVTELGSDVLEAVRRDNCFSRHDDILVFGSTRPGDEALAAACWREIKDEFPNLRLVIAPRHQQRLDEALAPFGDEAVLLRSSVQSGKRNWRARVFFLDTLGELAQFYGIATIAVMGGSFFPGVEGHNPLEPAALGVPTVFGPFMGNFPDASALLLAAGGAVQLSGSEALLPMVRHLLQEPKERERIASRGRKAILANQGAVERNIDLLMRCMQ